MPGLAPHVASWGRKFPRQAIGPSRGASLSGTSILTQQFGQNLQLVVEVAWGANLAADQSTWKWTDITSDVQYAQKVTCKIGRTNESTTPPPAVITLTVNNSTGKYSKGPQSPNYPNVKKGTPLRVSVIYSGVRYVRAQGNIASYTPDWDSTGNYAVVHIEADGVKRRLNQGSEALQSTLRRSIPTVPSLVAYWPCEDGTTAGQLASALPGYAPLAISGGTPQLAAYTGFACSTAIPTFTTDTWSASIPAYSSVDLGQIRFCLATPTAGMPDQTRIFQMSTAGTIASLELRYSGTPAQGGLRLLAFDHAGATLYDSGTILFNVAGGQVRVSVQWQPSGLDMQFTLSTYQVNAPTAGSITGTATSQSLVSASNISFSPDGKLTGCSIGHIYLQGANDSIFTLYQQLNAFNGESPTARLHRLTTEQGEIATIGDGLNQPNMGPQTLDTFINLLEACAVVDQGYLVDGLGQGLTYFPRSSLENQPIALPLAANQIEQPVTPVDDDQLTVNTATANRPNGATVVYSDTTGPLSTGKIGTYSTSVTANTEYDTALNDTASWRVHLGNVDEYRYPTLNLALHHHPELLPYWLPAHTVLAGRVELAGLQSVRKQQDIDAVRLFAQGWQETIDQFTWAVQMNCSFWEPWRIILLAQDVGDTSEFLCRLDTDGSTTVGDTPAGSTTVSVLTPSGPLWVEGNGDDFPLTINLGGYQTVVSSIADGLANAGFESGIAPWNPVGCTAVQSSTHVHSGSFAAQITPDGFSAQGYLGSPLFPVVGGQAVNVACWVWFTNATTNFSLAISWFDSSGAFITTSSRITPVNAGTYTHAANQYTAPANAASGQVVPLLTGTPPSSQVWWLDDVQCSALPQVFTLASPTTADVPAGSPVSVWLPTYLTMG